MENFRARLSEVDRAWSKLKRQAEALLSAATTQEEEDRAIAPQKKWGM
jgi:hypothetical protein